MKNLLLSLLFIAGNCFSFSLTGSGTPEDPFIITNVHELQEIKDSLSAHYRLANDIDASVTASWNMGDHDEDPSTPDSAMGFYPIGTSSTPFTGSLNGAGYVITNLYINRPAADLVGLFGYVVQSSIDSLGLVDNMVIGRRAIDDAGRTGGLIGYAFLQVAVSHCYTTGFVNGGAQIGGLIGHTDAAVEVNDCFTTGTIHGAGYAGGLIGNAFGATVNDSYSSATITYRGIGVGIGGLIGSSFNSSVHRSYFTGIVNGKENCGGIVGTSNGSTVVSQCFNSGTVIGETSVGGIVGSGVNSSVVRDSYSTGAVRGNYRIGGIAGISFLQAPN